MSEKTYSGIGGFSYSACNLIVLYKSTNTGSVNYTANKESVNDVIFICNLTTVAWVKDRTLLYGDQADIS